MIFNIDKKNKAYSLGFSGTFFSRAIGLSEQATLTGKSGNGINLVIK